MATGKASPKKKILPPAPAEKKAAARPKPASKPVAAPKAKPSVKSAAAPKVKPPAKATVVKPAAPKKSALKIVAVVVPPPKPKKAPATEPIDSDADAKIREKKYAELFGVSLPKGKGVNVQGEPIKADELAAQRWCVMQFPPRPGRLSWIYATHGLSSVRAIGKPQPTRVELVMHWRDKSNAAVRMMTDVANTILFTGRIPAPGEFLSASDGIRIDENELMLKHVLAFAPEPLMPRTLDLPGGAVAPLMLLAISDAEREAAAKVRPDLADGRLVLMNALRAGGVFPVSDPKRQCLTRRRDYLRIWEAAFRGVRTNKT